MHNLTKLFSVLGIAAVAVAGFYLNRPLDEIIIVIGILAATFGVAVVKPTNHDDIEHGNS